MSECKHLKYMSKIDFLDGWCKFIPKPFEPSERGIPHFYYCFKKSTSWGGDKDVNFFKNKFCASCDKFESAPISDVKYLYEREANEN